MFAEKTSVGLFLQILGDLLRWNINHFLFFLQWCTSSSEMYPCTHLPIFSSAVWQLLTLSYCYLVRNTFSFYFSCHVHFNLTTFVHNWALQLGNLSKLKWELFICLLDRSPAFVTFWWYDHIIRKLDFLTISKCVPNRSK